MNINGKRIQNQLNKLGSIGYVEGKGTSRVAFTNAFNEGRSYVESLMQDAGLETRIDSVGNLIGTKRGSTEKIISIGSHIDTVPDGGIYDGTYGVIAGIEVLRTLKECDYQNQHTLQVIAFNEEEGNAVGGTFGSKAFAGVKQEDTTIEKCEKIGLSLNEIENAQVDRSLYDSYIELHIEQGGILENSNIQIGIVEGIVAIVRYMVTVNGEANHAGSTPMYLRKDALAKSCKLVNRLIEITKEIDRDMTCTVGYMNIIPGAVNVIPGKVTFPVEFRTMHSENILKVLNCIGAEFSDGTVCFDQFLWQDETMMDERIMKDISDCCVEMGLSYRVMPSGAGHDAINMAFVAPTAMLFIPSIGGISHSIKEYSRQTDICSGAELLYELVKKLDKGR